MDDNKRNQESQFSEKQQANENSNQPAGQQRTSNENAQNPQDGGSWNNYRTREMSDKKEEDSNERPSRERKDDANS